MKALKYSKFPFVFRFVYDNLKNVSIPGSITDRGKSPWLSNQPNNGRGGVQYAVEAYERNGWADIPSSYHFPWVVCQKIP